MESQQQQTFGTSGQEVPVTATDVGFQLGKVASSAEADKKKKKQIDAEQRIKDTFNLGGTSDQADELKRRREDYAVQLRKKNREEMFKQKRAYTGVGGTNTPAGATNQNLVAQQQQQPLITSITGTQFANMPNQQMQTLSQPDIKDDSLLDIPIEQALLSSQQMTIQDFTLMAQRMQFKIVDFQKLLVLIYDQNDVKVVFSTIGFRRLLSQEKNPPIQQVIDANLVPKFIQLLTREDFPKLQFEAAWCLTNLASGSADQVQVLIEKGTVKALINLLNSPHIEVVEQAIWGLGNIAGDSHKVRDIVLQQGAVQPISNILDRAQPGSSFVRNASWTLSNLCRGKPAPEFSLISRAVTSLAKVLVENDVEDILIDVCWAFSYLSDGGDERIQHIISTGVVPRLVQLLYHNNVAISVPSLRCIGNIVTGDDAQTQMTINAGALAALNELIFSKKKTVRKEVCWTLSNITAGSQEQIQQCLDIGIVDKLIQILLNDDTEIKKEAVWAVSNCTASANFHQFASLVERGIIKALLAALKMREARILAVALEGLENILKSGQQHFIQHGQENKFSLILENEGGLELIETLQMHPNHQIYDRALKILEQYFQEEDDYLNLGAAPSQNQPQANAVDFNGNGQAQFKF